MNALARQPTYYDVLGVSPRANGAELREAWKNLMRENHPDTFPLEQRDRAHVRAALINEAYETLADERKRGRYDAKNRGLLHTLSPLQPGQAADLLNQLRRERRNDRLRVAGAVAAGVGAVAYTLRAAKLL